MFTATTFSATAARTALLEFTQTFAMCRVVDCVSGVITGDEQ